MNKYSLSIIGSGILWGFMGLFTRQYSAWGFSSPNTVFIRSLVGGMMFGFTMLLTNRKSFIIKLKDLWCFLGSGLCSLLFFTVCYFKAIELNSLSVAAILLYTAPSFVMLMSLLFFGEKMTGRKLLALAMAFGGSCLVSGIGSGNMTLTGLIYGLCAGFGYALYTIFSRFAMLRGYGGFTINFYSCLFCAIGAGLVWGAKEPVVMMFSSSSIVLFSILFAFAVSYLPYLLYTYGMIATENGKASVMASVEPVVATLVGILVFKESMSIVCAVGILLVLGAIGLLNMKEKEHNS